MHKFIIADDSATVSSDITFQWHARTQIRKTLLNYLFYYHYFAIAIYPFHYLPFIDGQK